MQKPEAFTLQGEGVSPVVVFVLQPYFVMVPHTTKQRPFAITYSLPLLILLLSLLWMLRRLRYWLE